MQRLCESCVISIGPEILVFVSEKIEIIILEMCRVIIVRLMCLLCMNNFGFFMYNMVFY